MTLCQIDTNYDNKGFTAVAKGVGERLRNLRKLHKKTQDQVGKILHYSRSHISNIETDRRSLRFEDILLLSEYFNVSIMYLLGEDFLDNNNEILYILDSNSPLDITKFSIDDKIKIAKMYVDIMKRCKNKTEPHLSEEELAE